MRSWPSSLTTLLVVACAPAPVARPPASNPPPNVEVVPATAAPTATPAALAPLPEVAPLAVRWSTNEFASRFWALDQLSRWSEVETFPAYRSDLEKRWKLSPADEKALADYARIRAKTSTANDDDAFDLLPPDGRPSDRFASAFLAANGVGAALDALSLEPKDRRVVEGLFRRFDARLSALLADATYVDVAKQKLEALAARAKMASFLAVMAQFYGVEQRVASPLEVVIPWAPDESQNATQIGRFMVIPVSKLVASHDRELGSWLGVTVHEFGHYFASRLPKATKDEVNRRLLERLGLVNRRHPNVFDEATQTALGNILFMRERLPELLDDASFYAYEPENDRPDAIDTLARALEPVVRSHLGRHGAFAKAYLSDAVSVHEKVFPPVPLHHTRVVLAFTETKPLRNVFKGLFPAISREMHVGLEDIGTAALRPPGAARWVVVTRDYARQHPGELSALAVKSAELAEHMERDASAACLRAARRETGGLDFLAMGRDRDALRRLLISSRGKVRIPLWEPLCVGP